MPKFSIYVKYLIENEKIHLEHQLLSQWNTSLLEKTAIYITLSFASCCVQILIHKFMMCFRRFYVLHARVFKFQGLRRDLTMYGIFQYLILIFRDPHFRARIQKRNLCNLPFPKVWHQLFWTNTLLTHQIVCVCMHICRLTQKLTTHINIYFNEEKSYHFL